MHTKKFSYLHKEINLLRKSSSRYRYIIKKNDNYNDANFSIRFHIYPGMTFQTMGGNGILLQINKNNSLIFQLKIIMFK